MRMPSMPDNADLWSRHKARVSDTPFAHAVIDDFLPEEILQGLIRDLDVDRSLLHHKGWGGNRLSVQFGTTEYGQLLDRYDSFRRLHEALLSSESLLGILELFSLQMSKIGLKRRYRNLARITYRQDKTEFVLTSSFLKRAFIKFFYNPVLRRRRLRRYIRTVTRRVLGTELYPLVSFSVSKGGYLEPVHTDSRHKVIVGLLYLENLNTGGDLQILKLKNSVPRSACIRYPKPAEVEPVISISPRQNRLVIFLNSNDAYHATTPFDGLRRFVYLSYAVSREESAFETDYVVRLGDEARDGRI
jgi:hypothetical protein